MSRFRCERLQYLYPDGEGNVLDKSLALSDVPFCHLEWYYADNGFRSLKAMEWEHEPVVKLASSVLAQATGNVLDLGCGNGVLVKKICDTQRNLIPWGVDRSRIKIAHARMLNPRFADNLVCSHIFDDGGVWSKDREFQMVVLMLGRLTEVPEAGAETLLTRIRQHARSLLVYVYDGYRQQQGSILELARTTGITLSCKLSHENVAMVDLRNVIKAK